jgi:uncharacterized protein YgiB involved in biofilm formation
MERSQRPFSVYRRRTKKKGSFVYYCRFRGEDGQYVSALSTGQTSRAAAENWADTKLKDGKISIPVLVTKSTIVNEGVVFDSRSLE